MRRIVLVGMLLILPVILCSTAFVLKEANGPYYLGENSDPEYAFLLMSLNVLQGNQNPAYLHPGTTMILLESFALQAKSMIMDQKDIKMDVLKNPEYHLTFLNIILITMNCAALFFLGLTAYWVTHNILFSLLIQLSPFLSTYSLLSLPRVSLEPLLLTCCLLFILLIVLNGRFRENQRILTVLFAVVSGFSLATKVTFAPLLVIPLILLPGYRSKTYFILLSAISFELFTLPLMRNNDALLKWLMDIASHTGRYGGGEIGFVKFSDMLTNSLDLINQEKVFGAVFFVTISFIVTVLFTSNWRRILLPEYHFKALIAITAAQLGGILIVLKHYSPRYSLPITVLTGAALASEFMCISVLASEAKSDGKTRYWPVVIMISIAVIFLHVQKNRMNTDIVEKEIKKEIALMLQHEEETTYKNDIIIFTYASSSLQYALHFGNYWWTNNNFSKEQEELFGNKYYFMDGPPAIFDWSFRKVDLVKDLLSHHNRVILHMRSNMRMPFDEMGVDEIEVSHTITESLYELRKKGT